MTYLEHINFFAKSQYGFLKKRSTATAVFDLIHTIQTSLDQKRTCGMLLVDLTNKGTYLRCQFQISTEYFFFALLPTRMKIRRIFAANIHKQQQKNV